MIRFVDLTEAYFASPKAECAMRVCAFVDTTTDRFVDVNGRHTLFGPDEIDEIANVTHRERCRALVPDGFWGKR